MIIRQQITRDIVADTMQINQSVLNKNLIIEKKLKDCNANIIPIKTRLFIKMLNRKNFNKTDLQEYQQLVGKLMYLASKIRPDIAFAIEQ